MSRNPVVSRGRCNTGLQFIRRSFRSQCFSWPLIEAQGDLVQVRLRVAGQIRLLRQVLPQEAVRVFVRTALPWALGIAEVNLYVRSHREAFVLGHLQPAVPGQRAPQRRGQSAHVPAQGGHHRSRVLAGHLHQHAKPRMTLHQRGHMTVARPAQQIAFPMTGNGAIFDFRRSLADRNGGGSAAGSEGAESAPFSALLALAGIGCDKWFHATRAGPHPWETDTSAIRKLARATSPASVYSQRSPGAWCEWPAGTAWAAGPIPRPADRLHWRGTARARHWRAHSRGVFGGT